ncbi:methyltransferase [Gemmata sp. G18]|uniref:Methyltransferase n=1 Tax=Gemmata palustris TaxID=2822762 RepID=A0ABS5BJC0_9BACT|nr:methyltransferase [Gemmata palustris]MBP3953796.1 methyltransferase [Gemmata palustris]
MSGASDYVLGQSERAARRLALQDLHFAAPSEALLDALALRPADRVVELGCGPGAFTRRILNRLGANGVVVGVDSSSGLLEQAKASLAQLGGSRFQPTLADVAKPGAWIDGADVVTGRAVLHHVPMAEFLLGRLRARLRPGTRIGFLEPDFRSPLARIAHLEATSRPELAPLLVWAKSINDLYSAWRISPCVGATLAQTLETAGYSNVRHAWHEFPTDETVIENIQMIYDEVRDTYVSLGILSAAEIDEQQRLLRALPNDVLPAVWGLHQVSAVV